MINVVKKLSISSELARKMVNAAVAKATELGVNENVAILYDGGNLKAFNRSLDAYDRDCAEQGVYSIVRCLHSGLFQLHSGRPIAFGGHSHAFASRGVGWRVSH